MQRNAYRKTRIVPGIWLLIAPWCFVPSGAEAKGTVAAEQASAKIPEARILDQVTLPKIDLDLEVDRQVVVDRETGQYLGHVSTVLLEDGKTMYAVYPKGHGRGAIVMKRSRNGGRHWSDRLPTPASWATSLEVPTIHRVVDPQGTKRLILWSGLYPARLAVSGDDGRHWSELKPVGDWGGIVVMGFVEPIATAAGHYLAMFGEYMIRFKDNTKGYDTSYPGVEVLPDGTFVTTTYGHWEQGEPPYILSMRVQLAALDALANRSQPGE